ncbi:glycosyltransferase family 2 protein [uncultured Erythrobacter sp.]|uniref:glycosyltransferase family 2 protein n=1 Tax=uncultured Erythrobacter sp. TaxID=263913 RepID=UPI00260D6C07|nr:glycosyltransferase family 2 protein [uncultured Erythrobacter sp.]
MVSSAWRGWLAAFAFLASVTALVILSRSTNPSIGFYVAAMSIGSAAVALSLWKSPAITARTVMLVAVAAHGLALFGETRFEDDFYRFIWDGWRVLETGTPYGVAPLDFYDNLAVPPAMQQVLEWINYPELPTIYGPVLQGLFAITTLFSGADPLGLRILFGGATLLISALLLRRFSPEKVALFAWSPMVVAESTLHLHPDILLSLTLVAALYWGRRHPVMGGALLGLAAGVKLVALAAWPVLLRLPPKAMIAAIVALLALYSVFAVQGQGVGFETTATFASDWYFNAVTYELLDAAFGPEFGRLAALGIAGVLVLWAHAIAHDFERVPLGFVFGAILLFAPTVNPWYLVWILPFAVGRREVTPYVASVVLPLSYFTGFNLDDLNLADFDVHPYALVAERLLLAAAIGYDIFRAWQRSPAAQKPKLCPISEPKVSVIIPALNEETSIGKTVQGILKAAPTGLSQVIVADNGSSDDTAQLAREAGASVVYEPERGYGAACLTGLSAVSPDANIILFMDADLSDVPEEAASLLEPIISGEAEMVIGSRALGQVEKGAMTTPQRLGNWLAPALVRMIWRMRYTDLGPFRAVRRSSLDALAMADRDFGWTIEMQVRAAKLDMRVVERPVSYRRRIGQSKISGTIRGVLAAGTKILYVIAREAFGDFGAADRRKARPSDAAKTKDVTISA